MPSELCSVLSEVDAAGTAGRRRAVIAREHFTHAYTLVDLLTTLVVWKLRLVMEVAQMVD